MQGLPFWLFRAKVPDILSASQQSAFCIASLHREIIYLYGYFAVFAKMYSIKQPLRCAEGKSRFTTPQVCK